MAHDLRKISNKNYNAYGNGRDWFFIGDSNYRNGARTPLPNQSGNHPPTKPPSKVTGAPKEVVYHRARLTCTKKAVKERWQKIHAEVPRTVDVTATQGQENLARTTGGRGARLRGGQSSGSASSPGFATTYDLHGRHPEWTGTRYELRLANENKIVGVPRNSSEPVLKELEGDFTRGIRSKRPHFVTAYQNMSQEIPAPEPRHEVGHAKYFREAVTMRKPGVKEIEGDHSQGISASYSKGLSSHMMEIGVGQAMPKWVGEERKQLALAEELRDAGVHGVPAHERPGKLIEGDHTLGIRSAAAHFSSTYADLGGYQKVNFKRYESRVPQPVPVPAGDKANKLMEGDHTQGIRSDISHYATTYSSLGACQ